MAVVTGPGKVSCPECDADPESLWPRHPLAPAPCKLKPGTCKWCYG